MDIFQKTVMRYKDPGQRMFIRMKNRLILPLKRIEKAVPKKGKVIELGSGLGMVCIYLALSSKYRDIRGLEIDPFRVKSSNEAATGMGNVSFVRKDLSKGHFPVKGACVLMVDFLHHVPPSAQESILGDIAKNQKKGDRLVIKEIEKGIGLRYSMNFLCDKFMTRLDALHFRSAGAWVSKLESLGYETTTERFGTLFPHILIEARKR